MSEQIKTGVLMTRLFAFALSALFLLVSCAPTPPVTLGADGKPIPRVYTISAKNAGEIKFRMLDSVNQLRAAAGARPLALNPQLTAAAATHSRDMSRQNRAWHFGSDGSSPLDRVRRAGYPGQLMGEDISETYESEIETLSAWMDQPDTRAIIMDKRASQLGFDWYQEENGKIWWTLITGS